MDAKAPLYRRLSPIGFWSACVCVAFDAILAYYLYKFPVRMIDSPFGWVYFWPSVFVILALYLAVALKTNNMKGVRGAMILNVLIKTYWAYTLIILALKIGIQEEIYLLDLWFFATFIQAIIAVFTPPRIDYGLFIKE